MVHDIRLRRYVEFSETDMAGLVHFTQFFRYAEAAEAALFRQLGEPLIHATRLQSEGWPRVRAECSFMEPVRFGDELEIHLIIKAIKLKAIEYAFKIYRLQDQDSVLAARGGFTTVFARLEKDTFDMTSASLPPSLLQKIEEAPESLWNRKKPKT